MSWIQKKNSKKHFECLIELKVVLLRKNFEKKILFLRLNFIRFDDLWHVMTRLGEHLSKSEVKEMFAEANRNLDDKISFSEFIEMLRYS